MARRTQHRFRRAAGQVLATAALVLALGVLATSPAAARPESDAPNLRSDVEAAGHWPRAIVEGQAWTGFLRLAPGSNVTGVLYQVCRVGQACFAAPQPATREANGTWTFPSERAGLEPIRFQAGWHLGIKWALTTPGANGTSAALFPPDDPACACADAAYFTFDVGEARNAATTGLWGSLSAIASATLAVAGARRARAR